MPQQLAKTSDTEQLAIAPAHSSQSALGRELYKGSAIDDTILTRFSEPLRRLRAYYTAGLDSDYA
jgi:hypothetical protein